MPFLAWIVGKTCIACYFYCCWFVLIESLNAVVNRTVTPFIVFILKACLVSDSALLTILSCIFEKGR